MCVLKLTRNLKKKLKPTQKFQQKISKKKKQGGYDESYHKGEIQWAHLDAGGYYNVKLNKMKIGDNQEFSGGFGSTIVDSGTTYSYFPHTMYNEMKQQVMSICSDKRYDFFYSFLT